MNRKNKNLIFIRELSKKDLNDLYELLQNLSVKSKKFFHPHEFDLKTLNELCKNNKDYYFVMISEKKLIGYSFLRFFGYDIPSFGCCIRNGYENKGYGILLTKWTIDKARELGYEKVILKTYKENVPAQKIYKKIGFKIFGETEDKKQYKMELIL